MSEAPKRLWLNVCIGSFEHLLRCESGTETMYVSEDALRELCEELRAMAGDVSDIDSAFYTAMARAYDECADKIEKLLEGK